MFGATARWPCASTLLVDCGCEAEIVPDVIAAGVGVVETTKIYSYEVAWP